MPALPLSAIPAGTDVLLDANVIVYALGGRSVQCGELLRRCSRLDVLGFMTVESLAEACHRLMIAEAAARGLIARANASNLQGKPHVVRALSDYWPRLDAARYALAVLALDEVRFARAHSLRSAHGLMTNDSLLLAAADVFGLSQLATNDTDFDHVPWLSVYAPTDLLAPGP